MKGTISSQEEALVDELWKQSVEDNSYLQNLPEEKKEALKKEMFTSIQFNIGEAERSADIERRRSVLGHTVMKFAAIFIGLLMVASISYLVYYKNTDSVNYTPYGSTMEIFLPDSSSVILNGNSKIRYARNWEGGKKREVWVYGEAYFKVKKYKVKGTSVKFVVHANDLNVEVLGTEFNVKNRRKQTVVTLNEGAIQLKSSKILKNMKMTAGETVLFSQEKGIVGKHKQDTKLYSSWKDEELFFENTSLSDIATLLEDNYGYKVTFEDKASKHKAFTGTSPTNDINILLTKLSITHDLTITTNEKSIMIKKND